jgi:hypothetical protein
VVVLSEPPNYLYCSRWAGSKIHAYSRRPLGADMKYLRWTVIVVWVGIAAILLSMWKIFFEFFAALLSCSFGSMARSQVTSTNGTTLKIKRDHSI